MIVLALLSLRLELTNETIPEFLETTKSTPALVFLQSPFCDHCRTIIPNWTIVSHRYENDSSVILAEADCHEDSEACRTIHESVSVPSFFIVRDGAITRVYNPPTVEVLCAQAEQLARFDSSLPCLPWFYQPADEYPQFALSFPDDPPTACQRLTAVANAVPRSDRRFFLGARRPFSFEVQLSVIWSTDYTGPEDFDAEVAYARDLLHLSMGEWPIEECDLITQRRLGFLVYATEKQLKVAQPFGMKLADDYCFGIIEFAWFDQVYVNSGLTEDDMPIILILNQEHTHFKVVQGLIFDDSTVEYFAERANEGDDADMVFEFKRPWEAQEGQAETQEAEEAEPELELEPEPEGEEDVEEDGGGKKADTEFDAL